MKIKLNKKSLAVILACCATFSYAKFVTLVSAESVGGIVVASDEYSEGSVVFRVDNNPSDVYGGTWKLISGNATLYLGDGTEQSGLVEGSDFQETPLMNHTHTVNHDHGSFTSYTTLSRLSSVGYGYASGTSASVPTSGWSGFVRTGDGTGWGLKFYNTQYNKSSTINPPNASFTSGSSGDSNSKIDVSGAKLKLNVWQKIG